MFRYDLIWFLMGLVAALTLITMALFWYDPLGRF
jgi:uncharacterized membrane protein